MKRWIKRSLLAVMCGALMMMTLCLHCCTVAQGPQPMRGVWVSTVYNLDFPSSKTLGAAALRQETDAILDHCAEWGMNAVFLQVRPSADAIYPSEIFPQSRFVAQPSGGFDLLAYWVTEAHRRGIELHAWINPYRVTTNGDAEWVQMASTSPAKLHPEWTVRHTDGNYYFDPAIPEVRQLVLDGAQELLEKYAVDGIHMDDYFYPGVDFPDDASFASYGADGVSREDWRRNNVDQLVLSLAEAAHASNRQFGISPCGVWENASAHPLGSQTKGGNPSYSRLFADSRKWAAEGWIDYIAPQIYWERGHSLADYQTLVDWWADVTQDSSTKLYIGLGDYRAPEATPISPWYRGAEVAQQMAENLDNSRVDGEIHFRYGSILATKRLEAAVTALYHGKPLPTYPLRIVLDPGHGGTRQLGSTSAQARGYLEKDLNFRLATAVRDELARYDGVEVTLTREGDDELSLAARAAVAQACDADLLVSLHFNSAEDFVSRGAEVFVSVLEEYRKEDLAQAFLQELKMLGITTSRGVRQRATTVDLWKDGKRHEDYYGILRESAMRNLPAVLVEHVFLSNESDLSFLGEAALARMALADATAIARTYGLTRAPERDMAKLNVTPVLPRLMGEAGPTFTVRDGTTILEQGTDYSVTYQREGMTVTAVLQGLEPYRGTQSVTYSEGSIEEYRAAFADTLAQRRAQEDARVYTIDAWSRMNAVCYDAVQAASTCRTVAELDALHNQSIAAIRAIEPCDASSSWSVLSYFDASGALLEVRTWQGNATMAQLEAFALDALQKRTALVRVTQYSSAMAVLQSGTIDLQKKRV